MLLSVNVVWDKEGPAKRFVEEFRLPFPVGRDADARIGTLYGVEATPTTLFIGKNGKLVERHEGGLDEAAFEQRLNWLLGS